MKFEKLNKPWVAADNVTDIAADARGAAFFFPPAKTEYWRWTEYTWHADKDWRGASTITAGIDVGAVSTQAVIMIDNKIYAICNTRTLFDSSESGLYALHSALKDTGMKVEDIQYVVGTGYGRINMPMAQRKVTEIACHARGAHFMNNAVRTILDIGSQDYKAIQCDERGRVTQFLMNDKCAAGVGSGMEVIADLLAVPITQIGPLSLAIDKEPPMVSNICVIFAKTGVMGLISHGSSKAEVLASYCEAMVHRMCTAIQHIGMTKEFAITGGMAKNLGIAKRMERLLGVKGVEMKPDPQIAGALGAALFARDSLFKSRQEAKLAS